VRLDLDSAAVGSPLALTGGEAHALLATFPAEAAAALPGGFRVIGRVVAGEGLSVDGRPYDARGGWDPYRDGER
jgi:thiamine-monophosphate kinase